jgi:hypothetical protein
MNDQKEQTKIYGSNLTNEQRANAEKLGINLSPPNQIIILTQKGEFKLKTTKRAISDYNNGLLAMHIKLTLDKLGGGKVVNDNIPIKIKEIKAIKKVIKPIQTNTPNTKSTTEAD